MKIRRKIVLSIDDGLGVKFSTTADLDEYVSMLRRKENLRELSGDPDAVSSPLDKRFDDAKARQVLMERRKQNSTNASHPRIKITPDGRPFTKAALIVFRDAFVERGRIEGRTNPARGWMTAASLEFGIDQKTLKNRMTD